jgi:hypothetical protein
MKDYDLVSGQDAVFLAIENINNPMTVGAVQFFEPSASSPDGNHVDIEQIRAFIDSRSTHVPRFRQRIDHTPFERLPIWVDSEPFDIERHVGHRRIPLRQQ